MSRINHNIRQTTDDTTIRRLGSLIRDAKTAKEVRDKVRATGAETMIGEVGLHTKKTSNFSRKRSFEATHTDLAGEKTAQFHKKSRTGPGSNR